MKSSKSVESDIEIPQHILTARQEQEKMIEEYEEQKKQKERYLILKRQLESYKEARPMTSENIKDQQAVKYFEDTRETIVKNINQLKEKSELEVVKHQQAIDQLKDKLENLMTKQKQQLQVQEQKLLFVDSRLTQAKQRAISLVKRSKEEIRYQKEVQDLILEYKLKNPDKDLEYALPGYKTFLENNIYTPENQKKEGIYGEQKEPTLPQEAKKTGEKVVSTLSPDETVEMPPPDGKPEVFKYGKRVPKNMSLEEAIKKQNEPTASLQPTTHPEPTNHPKIIKITKKVKPADETNS